MPAAMPPTRSTATFRLGMLAIVISFIPWLALAALPFAGLDSTGAGVLIAVAVIVAELLFWTGTAVVGHQVWQVIRRSGWRQAPAALLRMLARGRADGGR